MGVGRLELTPHPSTGELWWAAPDPVVGREQSGRRPVLVISNARYHQAVTTLAVTVPVTSVDRRWPNHVRIPRGAGLPQDSFAMTEQVRTISRRRLVERIGVVGDDVLGQVLGWVRDWIA
ncbi:type II toxin-antitoxin system PemK/MazF family toxin [Actinomyces sp. Z3]|nr:type II toxin-antitoxin system PemK/MazF family toxin [Actinomyces sp. Z3]